MQAGELRMLDTQSYFLRQGQYPNSFAFVLAGIFRYVYYGADGNEYTKSFMPEHSVISSYTALRYSEPSGYAIQALEEAYVWEVPFSFWEQLRRQDPAWNSFLITLLERGYAVKERREKELLLWDAEARYHKFLERFPGLVERVQQQHIASYLGIKAETFSRLKKRMGT